VPTQQDFIDLAWVFGQLGHGNGHGTYHMPEHLRNRFHREFITTWRGIHHGFSDREGKVYEEGRVMYYWERLLDGAGWQFCAWEEYLYGEAKIMARSESERSLNAEGGLDITMSGEESILSYWEIMFDPNFPILDWRTFATNKIYEYGRAVYYWSQSSHSPRSAYVLGLSAGREAENARPSNRMWRSASANRHNARIVLPQVIFDKGFGLTLRCVK
jgi:hypothetical protein